jgi:F-type H+-transporting ATPase subunit b
MTFNWWTFVFEVVNFVVLAYVLHRILYRPLQAAIKKRRDENARVLAEAETARRDAADIERKLQEQLADLEHQRHETIRQAREQAEVERRSALVDAEKVMQRRQDEVRAALERERAEALIALQAEGVTMAVGLASRLLEQAVNRTLHGQLAERLLETLNRIPETERPMLREQLDGESSVTLETAAQLDEETTMRVAVEVSDLLGRPTTPAIVVRPELTAGVRLCVGGHIWDASVAGWLATLQLGRPGGTAHV